MFGALAFFNLHYAKELNSKSLKKDRISSAVGAVLAASLFINTALAKASRGDLWWLDPFVPALTCGIVSFVYGLQGIYKAFVSNRNPVFSFSWWLYGRDRGTDKDGLEMRHPGATSGWSLPNMTSGRDSAVS